MKDLKKLKNLTNNPLTLLFGVNHFYLNRVLTMFFRALISIVVIMLVAVGVFDGSYDALYFILFLYVIYFVIDKIRIEKHLNKLNAKFQEAFNLLRDKQFFKGFKKLVKLGLKDSIFWIMENDPELLTGSLLQNVDKKQFEKLTKQIENKDVDGVISSIKRIALNF